MISCDTIVYRLGAPCPSISHRDDEETQTNVAKNDQAGQVSLVCVHAPTDAALAAAADRSTDKANKDVPNHADWIVVQPRCKQKESGQEDGKDNNATSRQQSRVERKSTRPRRRRRMPKSLLNPNLSAEGWVRLTQGRSNYEKIMHGSSRPQSNKSQSTPRSMPLAPIHTLVPYCPDKISQKP